MPDRATSSVPTFFRHIGTPHLVRPCLLNALEVGKDALMLCKESRVSLDFDRHASSVPSDWSAFLCRYGEFVCLFVGCLTSQQQASVSQGRICSDNCACCHTEIEVADPTFYLTQSQYTDTGPTSPRTDPITPGAWQGSHWSANFEVTGMTRPRKNPGANGIRTWDLPLSRRTP